MQNLFKFCTDFKLYVHRICPVVIYLEHFKSRVTTSNTSTKHVLPSIYEKVVHYEYSDCVLQPSEKTPCIFLDFCINLAYS